MAERIDCTPTDTGVTFTTSALLEMTMSGKDDAMAVCSKLISGFGFTVGVAATFAAPLAVSDSFIVEIMLDLEVVAAVSSSWFEGAADTRSREMVGR